MSKKRIKDKSSQKACLKSRRNRLFKRIKKLSTRYGVDACAIVYSPNDGKYKTWPQSNEDVMKTITSFENLNLKGQLTYNRLEKNDLEDVYKVSSVKTEHIDERIEQVQKDGANQNAEEIPTLKEPIIDHEFENFMKGGDNNGFWAELASSGFFDGVIDDAYFYKLCNGDGGAGPSFSYL